MCGENYLAYLFDVFDQGSPPRVRGKPFTILIKNMPERITPACAGKTCLKTLLYQKTKDHPRVCGENETLQGTRKFDIGSPPRVRGKHLKQRY